MMEPLELARKAAEILNAKKARDIQVIKITEISSMADYLVIAGCTSSTQVKSLSEEVEEKLGEKGTAPMRTDGFSTGSWIVMDYGTVLIHIFHENAREFYKLERIWADGVSVDISDIITPDSAE